MKNYAINVFWSDKDDSYIATVPDLRGCSAFGDSPEGSVREVEVAKSCGLNLHAHTAITSLSLRTDHLGRPR
jgi:predicted RNase H-like HicB family nuclease